MASENERPELIPSGSSPEFTEQTIPDALLSEHQLGDGHWAELNVIEGSIRFVDLTSGDAASHSAPSVVLIRPNSPHHVSLEGPVRLRIDFFREKDSE